MQTMIHRITTLLAAAWLLALWAAPLSADTYELKGGTFQQVQSWPEGSPEHGIQQIRRLIAEKESDDAVDLADDWIKQNPYHPMIAQAYLLRGDAKAQDHSYYKALYDYEMVINLYPDSEAFFPALEREFQIAQTFSSGVKRRLWGMRIMPAEAEAEEFLIRIQERTPGSSLAEQAGKALGDHYYNRKEMLLAAEAYDIFLENYPRSQWRPEIMKKLIDANLATFKGPRFDATGLIEARERIDDYKRDFPASAEKQGADALLVRIDESLAQKALVTARWYDKKDKLVSAKFMYKRVIDDYPGSSAAQEASRRLEALGVTVQQPEAPKQPAGQTGAEQPEPTQTDADAGSTDQPADATKSTEPQS
jgi:outer membrane assembly lipoprotein YfiO